MRVLVVGNGFTRSDQHGQYFVNRHTVDFLRGLAKSGHEVTLAQPVRQIALADGLNDEQLPPVEINFMPLDKHSLGALCAAIRQVLRTDFVHLYFPGSWSRAIGHLCRFLKIPFSIYLRGERFSNIGGDARLLRSASAVCTVAGLETRATTHNANVISVAPMLDFTISDQHIRFFDPKPNRPMRLLFVGRLETTKGVPELMEAAQILHDSGFSFELRLVGGGPLHEALSKEGDHSRIPQVSLLGLISDKCSLMAQYEWADVFVFPTHHEGFPRVLHEAMIKSCLIATTMVGGIPALMRDGHNCIALPVRDPPGIAAAIRHIACNRHMLQSLADAGHRTVLDVLTTRPSHLATVRRILNAHG